VVEGGKVWQIFDDDDIPVYHDKAPSPNNPPAASDARCESVSGEDIDIRI
tara:strand:- start:479 stop:628 length:150 start_codon:yes stop_codon:yes gene_type:complete